jgi:hypothetical protein
MSTEFVIAAAGEEFDCCCINAKCVYGVNYIEMRATTVFDARYRPRRQLSTHSWLLKNSEVGLQTIQAANGVASRLATSTTSTVQRYTRVSLSV